ncbi:unnamed protein product [Allacma fusca]|uniref:Peptidase A2 domain-containing protein n=1 Tax=Allacma fusca TaxID=39272 RepID=A0A8J2J5A2_9HEXA|nr:unnamed protein product [Allacma fusca]
MVNPQLMEDVLAKLPYQLQFQWCSKLLGHSDEPHLEDLSNWMTTMALAARMLPSKAEDNDTASHKLETCKKFLADDVKTRWQHTIQNRLCIGCFCWGHRVDSCSNKKLCGEQGCEKFHHQLLHKKVKDPDVEVFMMHTNYSEMSTVRSDVHLKVLPVIIGGPGGETTVNAIMDDGSTISLVDTELAQKLGIRGRNVPLCMQWTNGQLAHEDNSEVISFTIRGTHTGA